jgi:hypothetical protein
MRCDPDTLVNLGEGRALVGGTGSEQRTGHNLFLKLHEEENMRKLISILAASHAGAQPMKDDKKSEMKKGEKKGEKKAAKKAAKKEAKKDEMKK